MDPPDPQLSSLCLGCGLCCDGNLFTQVPLTAAELEPARRRGLVVLARADGSPALRQRCGALVGLRCDVYDDRPATCRSYRCMLHVALADGEVSQSEALGTVARAHALLAALADELPPDADAVMQRGRRALRDPELPASTRAAIERAAGHLARNFQRPPVRP